MSDQKIIYIFDMESGLSGALQNRVIEHGHAILAHRWDNKVNSVQILQEHAAHIGGVIISGSAKNINGKNDIAPHLPPAIFQAGVPVLAICYGMQYIAHLLGVPIVRCWDETNPAKRTKKVEKRDRGETGPVLFRRTQVASELFAGLGAEFPVWMKHNWMVQQLPEEWNLTGFTEKCPVAAIERGNIYAVQFHPEPYNSLFGRIMMNNFFTRVCKLKSTYF